MKIEIIVDPDFVVPPTEVSVGGSETTIKATRRLSDVEARSAMGQIEWLITEKHDAIMKRLTKP